MVSTNHRRVEGKEGYAGYIKWLFCGTKQFINSFWKKEFIRTALTKVKTVLAMVKECHQIKYVRPINIQNITISQTSLKFVDDLKIKNKKLGFVMHN